MMLKPATTQEPIHDIIANRWSGRAYDRDRPVSQTEIISMLEAARWAPSCYGDQPWRFIVCDKTTHEAAWKTAFDTIMPGNQGWAVNAPVLILICANSKFTHNDKPNRFSEYDTGAAAVNLCLQATDLGLMTHQMGGYDADKARAVFNIPSQFQPMAMLSVGYAAAIDTLDSEAKEREEAPRQRSALGELFFNGEWNQPII